MGKSLVPSGSLYPTRLDRQVGKALDRVEASNIVAKRTDVARIERITETGEGGMLAVGRLGMVEAGVAQSAPHVMPELHAIRSAATHGIVGVVYDAGRGA